MIRLTAVLKQFDKQGEKTGWTYLVVSEKAADELNPGVRTSFRVKGRLDNYAVEKIAHLPMGDGSFIMPLNAALRKGIQKQKGASVEAWLEVDKEPVMINADFLDCLRDEPAAMQTFAAFAKGHQNYFSKWIDSAKTDVTKAKRIAMAVNALAKGRGYSEMMRAAKKEKDQPGL